MIALVDTNSILSLVRYYLPFGNAWWQAWLQQQLQEGHILLLDAVHRAAGKLAYNELPWLQGFKPLVKTDGLLPPNPQKSAVKTNDHFARQAEKRQLTAVEFEAAKNFWLRSADARLVIKALVLAHENPGEEIHIITEESRTENDGKLFKKIPAIADFLDISTMPLPQYLAHTGLKVQFEF